MSGKQAKRIRRQIYGDYVSSLAGRRHFRDYATGEVVADNRRREYQQAKRAYTRSAPPLTSPHGMI